MEDTSSCHDEVLLSALQCSEGRAVDWNQKVGGGLADLFAAEKSRLGTIVDAAGRKGSTEHAMEA